MDDFSAPTCVNVHKIPIQEYTPAYAPGLNQYELLRLAAMAAKWQEPARDALDKLVLGCDTNPNGVDLKSMECIEQLDYLPFDPVIKRTEGTVKEMLCSHHQLCPICLNMMEGDPFSEGVLKNIDTQYVYAIL